MIFHFFLVFLIADKAFSANFTCLKSATSRGGGTIVSPQCNSGEEIHGALCYPKCKPGYEPVGCCLCRKVGCPKDFPESQDGASCIKPEPYGRGSGYPWKFGDSLNDSGMFARCEADYGKGKCTKWGAMVYPSCDDHFHGVGCCICSPDCPSGYTDIGAFCMKDIYGRGAGVSRLGCPGYQKTSGGLCYDPCKPGSTGVGRICWEDCKGKLTYDCNIFCTKEKANCAKATLELSLAAMNIDLTAAGKKGGQDDEFKKQIKQRIGVDPC